MVETRIYADFQNLDDQNRIRLDTLGTQQDLDVAGVELRQGLRVALYTDDADDEGNSDDLLAEGIVEFNAEKQCWVAAVDWNAIVHASDLRPATSR